MRKMKKTTFHVPKMDCPAEEQLIRMKLEGMVNIASLEFDIPNRKLDVLHTEDHEPILATLESLQLDTKFIQTTSSDHSNLIVDHSLERNLLWQVLAINFFFFALEIVFGFISDSMGLVADSLDMLADSVVYGLALFAIGSSVIRKKNIAKISGYFQMTLAIAGFAEVIRRFLGFGDLPEFQSMIIISILALIGNATSLWLLQRSNSREAHMQASMIFTSNDVIANIGVILAGGLVYATASKLPDLIVGAVIFVIVARGAVRIAQLAK